MHTCQTVQLTNGYVCERDNPYYFFIANHQKAGTKIYPLTQCSLTVNECDWDILVTADRVENKMILLTLIIYLLVNVQGKRMFNLPQFEELGSCPELLPSGKCDFEEVRSNIWIENTKLHITGINQNDRLERFNL